jgi:apolipoprotein D and lipocalin family protein
MATNPLHGVTALLVCMAMSGCATGPTRATDPSPLDVSRFMGSWHVIANIPYWAERNKVASRDEYRLRSDGRIQNDFVFRRGFDAPETRWQGVSTVVEGSGGRQWKVRFIWPFSTRLDILEVAPDHQWALLATPSRKLAWVLARDPRMEDAQYRQLLARFPAHGVDLARLERVPQFAEQAGQPGFQ